MEAINFYADAGCYNHSIRLTRAFNLDTELMRFALRAAPSLMIDCAVHFEGKGELEKAVQLFYKGGDLPRALDLCFRAGEMQKKAPPGGSKAAQAAASSSGVYEMMNSIVQVRESVISQHLDNTVKSESCSARMKASSIDLP